MRKKEKTVGKKKRAAISAYKIAGVNIDAGWKAVRLMKRYVKETKNKNCITDIGSFGGMYSFQNKILVASADGVGTKLKLAYHTGKHDTVGQDLVNHCVNDILVMGAKPLFFLDYFGTGKLKPSVAADVVKGLAKACKENNCVLLGGETAELPGLYKPGEYDLAGFIVGSVNRKDVIQTKSIKPGDAVIGLASSGLHTNGYSLALKMLNPKKNTKRMNEVLMMPHKSYLKPVTSLGRSVKIKGIAHITGGGFYDNIPRILPKGIGVRINKEMWHSHSIFRLIQKRGNVSEKEMYRVFNMGIGMIIIVAKKNVKKALARLKQTKQRAWLIGEIVKGSKKVVIS